MPDDPAAELSPLRREELIQLLETRGRLLQPDPDLIARALRRCARYDLRAGRERFSQAGVGSAELTATTTSVSGLDGEDHLEAVEQASRSDTGSARTEGVPFSIGVPSAVAKAATVPEEDGVEVEVAVRAAASPSAPSTPATSPAAPPPASKPIVGGMFQVGTEIAGYRIEGRLGRGGMGDVYRATQLSMGREVAFKVLSKKLAGDQVFRARFMREARAAGRLQHPNLIAVHDVGEQDGLLFFSMELVKGKSVGDTLKARGAYDEQEALEVIKQVLEALKYAHAHGLVHRDIKPDNIMVTDRAMVKVADLGLARQVEGDDGSRGGSETKSGTMMGTPYYMPPEQGQDARNADARSDIYAVGATLYHMVVGQVPFKGRTPVEVVVNATTKPLRFPEDSGSPKLRRLVARFMAKESADRPHDAEEAMIMLQRMMGGGSAPVATGVSGRFGERSSYLRSKHHDGRQGLTVWLVIGGVVLVLLIGTLVLLDQLGRANTWDNFSRFLDQEVEDRHYGRALERIGTFQAAHPHLAQRAEIRRGEVLAEWDRSSLESIDAQLAEFDGFLQQGNYKEAMRLLDMAGRNTTLLSPAATDRLEEARQRLVTQQDLAIESLRRDVGNQLGDGEFAKAFRQVEDFGPSTLDRQEEVDLILRHVGETWDEGVAKRAEKELGRVRQLLRQGKQEEAAQAVLGLRGQEHLVSPAVKIQLHQLQVLLDRADQTGHRFNPTEWMAQAQSWARGAKVEALDGGRFRFMGSGRVSLPEDPEMPVGMHLDLDLQITGDVDWTLSLGRLGQGRLIRVTSDRVSMSDMAAFGDRKGGLLNRGLRGEVLAEAGHRGSLRIELVWLKDRIEVSVAGLKVDAQRIPRSDGQAAFHVRWSNHGAVILEPQLGRE